MKLGKFAHMIALTIVGLFVVVVLLLLFVAPPAANAKALDALEAVLVGQVAAVVGYYFGAGHGAAEVKHDDQTKI